MEVRSDVTAGPIRQELESRIDKGCRQRCDGPEAQADKATVTRPQAPTRAAVPRGGAAAEWYRANNYFECKSWTCAACMR